MTQTIESLFFTQLKTLTLNNQFKEKCEIKKHDLKAIQNSKKIQAMLNNRV